MRFFKKCNFKREGETTEGHTFPENLTEIPQVSRSEYRNTFYVNISYFYRLFG